ncbi:hypothetical protein SDC9_89570 [bioreactor metagenome]|uniref:Uncharacterized protein n=1 Tax=bioreactor metagenome TaxID=1076179 RepID=A0A644ZR92_9ZZZZ
MGIGVVFKDARQHEVDLHEHSAQIVERGAVREVLPCRQLRHDSAEHVGCEHQNADERGPDAQEPAHRKARQVRVAHPADHHQIAADDEEYGDSQPTQAVDAEEGRLAPSRQREVMTVEDHGRGHDPDEVKIVGRVCCLAARHAWCLVVVLQRQPGVFAKRMEVNLRETFLRQPDVIRAGAQIGQRICGIARHAQWIGVLELAQFGRGVGRNPARAGVLAAFQANVAVVLGVQAVLHHFKLQLADGAQQHVAAGFGLEDLDGAFFAQLHQALLKLLGAQGVLQHHGHEEFRCEEGQAGELQVRPVGDGVAQLNTAMDGEADDVACVGFFHGFPALAHEGDDRGGAQFLAGALHLHLHAVRVLAGGHTHKGDAVAVVGVHIGLHLEDHAREALVFGVDDLFHGLLVDDERALAGAGWRGHVDHRIQHFHHTEVVHTGAEEHGRELACEEGFMVPLGGCADGELHAFEGVVE